MAAKPAGASKKTSASPTTARDLAADSGDVGDGANGTLGTAVIVRSNREAMKLLAERFLEHAKTQPFARHTVLVDSHAIGRNVVSGIAEAAGFAVGIETVTVGSFLRTVVAAIRAPANAVFIPLSPQPLTHHAIALAAETVIPQLQTNGNPKTQQIAAAIAGAPDITSKLSLVSELARSYNSARQTHLPTDFGLLEPWVKDVHDALTTHASGAWVKAADGRLLEYVNLWPDTIDALHRLAEDEDLRRNLQHRGLLPPRLFAYDLTVEEKSPAALALALVARSLPVDFFLVDPIVKASADPACQGWAHRSRVPLEATADAIGEFSRSETHGFLDGNHSLRVMQKCLAGEDVPDAPPLDKKSLAVHHVASDARAAEIVRDIVHQAFCDLEGLLPEDVMIVSDDPRRDTPFIEAAFASSDSGEELAVCASGANTRDKHAGVDAFLSALRLAPSSFARDAVFQLVAMQPVTEGLGLGIDDVETLEDACTQAGLRAYLDAQHRGEVIKVPGQTDHGTWIAALRSLAASMALPNGGHGVVTAAGIVPAGGLQATSMPLLASLKTVITALEKLRSLTAVAPLSHKVEQTKDLADLLFGSTKNSKALRAAIGMAADAIAADAASVGFAGDVDFFWFAAEFARRLNRSDSTTHALYGGVSLLSPTQARGRTPRMVVFLLSERFPTQDRPLWPPVYPAGVSVLRQQQTDLRDIFSVFMNTVDRSVFVVPSMCDRTRETLSMSSVVHDVKTIAESLTPKGVYLEQHEASVVPHSLKAMSSPAPTRHRGAIQGARSLHQTRATGTRPQIYPVRDLEHPVPSEVSLDDFLGFFEKPTQTYLRHRGLYVEDIKEDWQIRETMEPSFLDAWRIRDAVYSACDQHGGPIGVSDIQPILARMRASGVVRNDGAALDQLLDRASGRSTINAEAVGVIGIHQAWNAAHAAGVGTPVNVSVEYTLKNEAGKTRSFTLRVYGNVLVGTHQGTPCIVRRSIKSRKASDTLALAALQAVCQTQGLPTAIHRVDRGSSGKDVPLFDARVLVVNGSPTHLPLTELARIWHLGMQMPLPLFPDALMMSLPAALPANASNPINLREARTKYLMPQKDWGCGEGHDAKVISVFRGHDAICGALLQGPSFVARGGGSHSDFQRLAEFFSRSITDAFPMV